MKTDALKKLAAHLSGGHDVQCQFRVRDAVAEHGAVILEISTDDGEGIALPLTREAAEEIAHALVMPFRRHHLATQIARLLAECDDPQSNDGAEDHAKPH